MSTRPQPAARSRWWNEADPLQVLSEGPLGGLREHRQAVLVALAVTNNDLVCGGVEILNPQP